MKITEEALAKAMLSGDLELAGALLDDCGLRADDPFSATVMAGRPLVATTARYATILAKQNRLDFGAAVGLIDRLAMTVDIFAYLRAVIASTVYLGNRTYDEVPAAILEAVQCGEYTESIATAIEELDGYNFESLLVFIATAGLKQLDVKFNPLLVFRIYTCQTIPTELIFAYIGLCQRETTGAQFLDEVQKQIQSHLQETWVI